MPKQHEPAVRNTEIYSSRTTFQHIDDFLGNSQSRFFGNGYKLTNPLLKETLLSETTDGILSLESIGQLEVSAGQDWSKKANEVQRPHLSTVDAIVLIAKCLYSALSDEASRNSTRNHLGKIDVLQLEILSGKEPLEYDSHSNFPVLLQLDRSAPHPNFSGTIGNFSYRGKLTTGFQNLDSPVGEYNQPSSSSSLFNNLYEGFCGSYREKRNDLTDIKIGQQHCAEANLQITADDVAVLKEPSLVDMFVSTLQLGQLLLYHLDQINRSSSNTLWMRKTLFEKHHDAPIGDSSTLYASINKLRKLQMGDGTWRCADIHGSIRNQFEVTCSVAHKLPKHL